MSHFGYLTTSSLFNESQHGKFRPLCLPYLPHVGEITIIIYLLDSWSQGAWSYWGLAFMCVCVFVDCAEGSQGKMGKSNAFEVGVHERV